MLERKQLRIGLRGAYIGGGGGGGAYLERVRHYDVHLLLRRVLISNPLGGYWLSITKARLLLSLKLVWNEVCTP